MPIGFVGRRDDGAKVFLFEANKTTKVRDVRWGDFLNILEQTPDGWSKIKWGDKHYFIRTEHIVDERPVELIFLDVGQGGRLHLRIRGNGRERAHHDRRCRRRGKHVPVLQVAFRQARVEFRLHAAIVTHPDQDHYKGFQPSSITTRSSSIASITTASPSAPVRTCSGPRMRRAGSSPDIIVSDDDMRTLYADPAVRGAKQYPKLMHTAITSGRVDKIEMMSTEHGTKKAARPGCRSSRRATGARRRSRCSGPCRRARSQEPRLRWFGDTIGSTGQDDGKTKNGHSVILRMTIGKLNVLFGGDLNRPAEDYLLRHYSGIAANKPLADAVAGPHRRLGADVMKMLSPRRVRRHRRVHPGGATRSPTSCRRATRKATRIRVPISSAASASSAAATRR